MGNHLTECCCIETIIDQRIGTRRDRPLQYQSRELESKQREKLEEFFHQITSKAPVDYTNQEIKDIQYAVSIMLERIRTRVNRRGIFNIARIVPVGSGAEKTSLWKYCVHDDPTIKYLEFDYLGVLKDSIEQCENQTSRQHCNGCIAIVKPPMEYERLRLYYNRDEFSAYTLKNKKVISNLFLNEINYCLTSSCDCLSIQCDKDSLGRYKISLRPSVEHNHGCGDCTVDMPTGTLHVNTEINIDQDSRGPLNCSMIFQWNSKTKTLSAPDKDLLQKPKPIFSLPIYVDFLPALKSLKPTLSGSGDEHHFFIVPKPCNGDNENCEDRWRKSRCTAEIQAFTSKMSDKHRRCYQIMKYLSGARVFQKVPNFWPEQLPNYHIKSVVLRHHTTCSDTTDDCVDCVIRIFRDLQRAYEKKELLSYQSCTNIGQYNFSYTNILQCKGFINTLCSVSDIDTWETFIKKIHAIYM